MSICNLQFAKIMFNHKCHHNNEGVDIDQDKESMPCPGHAAKILLKKTLVLLILVLIIFFSVWSVESIVNMKIKLKEVRNIKAERTLTVSAEGKVIAVPDIANINFSVVTESKTAKDAQMKNTEKMNKVIDYAKNIDIDSKDIKTTSYYLNPKYDYINGRSIQSGYILTNSINIKVRKFDSIGDLIANSVDLGINQIGDVQFSIENPDEIKAQAGAIAMKNAKDKAMTLAGQAGVSLGKIITFSESDSGNYPMPYYMKSDLVGMGGGMESAPQIEQGSQEVKVVANIIFEIK